MNPGASANSIFICYRRDDSSDITGRIYDRLVQQFGESAVFKDVDTIPLGVDFRMHIDRIIKECSVVLVIIGDQWLKAGADGSRRIDSALDHVRVEIESALKREIPVVPLLVRNASHPSVEVLPESLQELAYRNGTDIRSDPHFNADVAFVVRRLGSYIAAKSAGAKQAHVASMSPPQSPPISPSSSEHNISTLLTNVRRTAAQANTAAGSAFSLLKQMWTNRRNAQIIPDNGFARRHIVARWTVGCALGEMVGTALSSAVGGALMDASQYGWSIRYSTLGADACCVLFIAAAVAFGQWIALKNLPRWELWLLATGAGWALGYFIAALINFTWNRNPWCANWYCAELGSSALGLPVARLCPFSPGMRSISQHWMFQALQALVIGSGVAFFQWIVLRRILVARAGWWIPVTAAAWTLVTPALNFWVSVVILNSEHASWRFDIVGQTALGAILGAWRGALIGALTGPWLAGILRQSAWPTDVA